MIPLKYRFKFDKLLYLLLIISFGSAEAFVQDGERESLNCHRDLQDSRQIHDNRYVPVDDRRHFRMSNIRNQVGRETLFNNRRIVDSDSIMSNAYDRRMPLEHRINSERMDREIRTNRQTRMDDSRLSRVRMDRQERERIQDVRQERDQDRKGSIDRRLNERFDRNVRERRESSERRNREFGDRRVDQTRNSDRLSTERTRSIDRTRNDRQSSRVEFDRRSDVDRNNNIRYSASDRKTFNQTYWPNSISLALGIILLVQIIKNCEDSKFLPGLLRIPKTIKEKIY